MTQPVNQKELIPIYDTYILCPAYLSEAVLAYTKSKKLSNI